MRTELREYITPLIIIVTNLCSLVFVFKRYLFNYYKHLLQTGEKEKCTGCGINLSFVKLVLREISFIFFTAMWLYQKTTVHNSGIISRTFLNTAQKKALRETNTFHIIRKSQSWNGGTSLCTQQQKSHLFLVHNSNKKTAGSLMKLSLWQI